MNQFREKIMTDLSQRAYTMATSEGVTVCGGIEFLENGMVPRSLRENLAKFSPGGDVRKILVDGLVHNHLDSHVSR